MEGAQIPIPLFGLMLLLPTTIPERLITRPLGLSEGVHREQATGNATLDSTMVAFEIIVFRIRISSKMYVIRIPP